MGIIFVDLAGTAEAFEDRIAPLYERWDEFFPSRDYDLLEPDPESGTWEQTLDCNWKLAYDTFLEAVLEAGYARSGDTSPRGE